METFSSAVTSWRQFRGHRGFVINVSRTILDERKITVEESSTGKALIITSENHRAGMLKEEQTNKLHGGWGSHINQESILSSAVPGDFLNLSRTTNVHVTPSYKSRAQKSDRKKWNLWGFRDETQAQSGKKRREFKISSISDLMVSDRKWNGMKYQQNDINNRQ